MRASTNNVEFVQCSLLEESLLTPTQSATASGALYAPRYLLLIIAGHARAHQTHRRTLSHTHTHTQRANEHARATTQPGGQLPLIAVFTYDRMTTFLFPRSFVPDARWLRERGASSHPPRSFFFWFSTSSMQ